MSQKEKHATANLHMLSSRDILPLRTQHTADQTKLINKLLRNNRKRQDEFKRLVEEDKTNKIDRLAA